MIALPRKISDLEEVEGTTGVEAGMSKQPQCTLDSCCHRAAKRFNRSVEEAPGSTDSADSPIAAAASNSHRLASILLDRQQAHFTDSRNETTATARSKGGHTLSVSFWLADPPDVSFFSVHCLRPANHRTADFTVLPHVVGAEGRFVLIRASFYCRYGKDEYFMYNAGDGESPSLEWVPVPAAADNYGSLGRVKELGIVPGDYRDHYLLAALCDGHHGSDYLLQIYSSETKAWSTRTLLNPCPGIRKIVPDKVIVLGEGLLGWVDFSRGLVACDLRQDPPAVHFIPLPEPLPENRDKLKGSDAGVAARSFRDVACVNGVLKFIEMEHHVTEKPSDPSDKDFLHDSDLIMSLKRKERDEKPKPSDGWRAVTWSRMLSSNGWSKGCTVDVADILADESTNMSSSSLSVLRGQTVVELTFRDLYSAFPTLSMDGDNILYLKSMATLNDQNGWVAAIDLGNNTGKALGGYSFEDHDPRTQAFCHCTLSRHLNMTPGIDK